MYKGNLEDSYGIIKYTNGDIYESNWENNMKNGKGIMKYNNGEIYEGEWENNKFKNGTITFKNKKINIQNYSFIINPKQIILIGDSFAWKTSIVNKCNKKEIFTNNLLILDNQLVKFEIIDTNNETILNNSLLNNIKIIIFVYDITQINSFKQLNEYYDEIIKIKGNKEIIFGVISNKNDLID